MSRAFDLSALRLLFVTDGAGDEGRIEFQVAAAIEGGVRAVQLREPRLSARDLLTLGERLRPRLQAVGGLLFVNDRVDCAAVGPFDGVQVGHRSIPWGLARRALGPDRLLGCSAHDERELRAAREAGADFAVLAPVWPTASKPTATALGAEGAADLTERAGLPVVWLGGVAPARCADLVAVRTGGRPAGLAAMSAIAAAASPRDAAASLLAALRPVLEAGRG